MTNTPAHPHTAAMTAAQAATKRIKRSRWSSLPATNKSVCDECGLRASIALYVALSQHGHRAYYACDRHAGDVFAGAR